LFRHNGEERVVGGKKFEMKGIALTCNKEGIASEYYQLNTGETKGSVGI